MVINLKEHLGRLDTPEHFFLLRFVFGAIASANDDDDEIRIAKPRPTNPYAEPVRRTNEMDELAKGKFDPSDFCNAAIGMNLMKKVLVKMIYLMLYRYLFD